MHFKLVHAFRDDAETTFDNVNPVDVPQVVWNPAVGFVISDYPVLRPVEQFARRPEFQNWRPSDNIPQLGSSLILRYCDFIEMLFMQRQKLNFVGLRRERSASQSATNNFVLTNFLSLSDNCRLARISVNQGSFESFWMWIVNLYWPLMTM